MLCDRCIDLHLHLSFLATTCVYDKVCCLNAGRRSGCIIYSRFCGRQRFYGDVAFAGLCFEHPSSFAAEVELAPVAAVSA